MTRPPPVIVLVDYNGLDDTRKCLASLAAVAGAARVVVVDNASRVDVAAALAGTFPWATFLKSDRNGGWAGSVREREAFRQAPSESSVREPRRRGPDRFSLRPLCPT